MLLQFENDMQWNYAPSCPLQIGDRSISRAAQFRGVCPTLKRQTTRIDRLSHMQRLCLKLPRAGPNRFGPSIKGRG